MWVEESSDGRDNIYADYTEMSLLLGHGCLIYQNGKYVTALGFGAKGCASPYDVRLGYKSPDGYGYAIWTFIIQCSVLKDDTSNTIGVSAWLYTLTGIHMVLGFASNAVVATTDFPELAYRLTGTGGYPKERVQDAFFHTFVKYDNIHRINVARILAENAYVADNDFIDYFNRYTDVDNIKLIITAYIP